MKGADISLKAVFKKKVEQRTMTIKTKKPSHKIEIDITGPQGNAFCLLGYAANYGKQLGYSKKKIEAMEADMKSKDYEHLIQVFDKHFGKVIDLVR